MELTKIQLNAVEKIYSYFDPSNKTKVDFKAPTGSGKTLMASYLISKIIERNPSDKFVFVIATPSSSSLPFFFEQKINLYKKDLPYSKFEVEYIESPSTKGDVSSTERTPKIKVVDNKVYIFGKATFGAKRIFTEQHVIDDFVDELNQQGYKLIYIRDEAHIGDLKTDNESKKFEILMQNNAHFILKMTATPNFADQTVNIVTIKESDLNDGTLNEGKWLLKTEAKVLLEESMSEEDLLDNALVKFKEIKDEYKTLENNGVIIRPALLIQVSNEPTDKDKKIDFLNSLKQIKSKIDFHGLSWVQYFGNGNKDSNRVYGANFDLDDITKIDNEIDVILFKVGPSTGWDIPRACMLLQLRKVCSDQLNIQTIGRIKRNPFPGLLKNDITDKYYVYSNSPQGGDHITFYNYKVKNEKKSEVYPSIAISNKFLFKMSAKKDEITDKVFDFLKANENSMLQDIRQVFVLHNDIPTFLNELYEANGSMVYSSVTNPFLFLKMLRRLIESKNNVYLACEDGIKKAFKEVFESKKIYENQNVMFEHLVFIILHKYTNNLQEIIRKCSPFTSNYELVMTKYDPSKFVEVFEKVDKEGRIDSDDDTYLFEVVKNNVENNKQPLDSGSEKIVFDELKKNIFGINEFLGKQIISWGKNHVDSSVNSDYLDSNHSFHKSYFDYILKFANGCYLYIEVKNKTDIDPEKTQTLREAYKDYFDKGFPNILNIPLIISLWVVEGTTIYTESFYDKTLFSKDLAALSPKDLLKTIALEKGNK